MSQIYDIIQAPKNLQQSDLPDSIELDAPFTVGDSSYVLVAGARDAMGVCERIDDTDATTDVQSSGNYYIIKKL